MDNNETIVGIIGWGMVGKSTAIALQHPFVYFDSADTKDIELEERLLNVNTIFICLPTPTLENGKQDISSIHWWLSKIENVYLNQINKPIVVIRSTVLPGTTELLAKKYSPLPLVYMPEFLSEATAKEDAEKPEFLVIGTQDPLIGKRMQKIWGYIHPVHETIFCSTTTAEMIKYTMNTFFALKVIFGNQIWDICRQVGADYSGVVKALRAHKWGSENGWDVWYGGFRGYGGHCLPKDTKALITKFKSPLLMEMSKINDALVKDTLRVSSIRAKKHA